MINLAINGNVHAVDVGPDMPLLWVLRDKLHMMGTKFGCGIAQCGACTVQINGVAERSCVIPVSAVGDAKITTIEGLSEHGDSPVQKAWVAHQVPQCGYCQSGLIMAVDALFKVKPKPTDAEIDAAITNICRCGTYARARSYPRRRASIKKADHEQYSETRPPYFLEGQRRRWRRHDAGLPHSGGERRHHEGERG